MPRGVYQREKKPPTERFWDKVEKTDCCWVWHGYRNRKGYGSFRVNGKIITSHRYAWLLHCGNIPQGLFVCHHCDNSSCVNPSHLFLATPKNNMRDMIMKGRAIHRVYYGEFLPSAKLSSKEVAEIKEQVQHYYLGLYSKLARDYKVTCQTISNISRGRYRRYG